MRKLKLAKPLLSSKEVKMVKGAVDSVDDNWYVSCECTYYNDPINTTNRNTTITCKCNCTY